MQASNPLHIGKIVQHARIFNLQHWHGAIMEPTDIVQAIAHLFALLQQRRISYVLVGGIALLQYIQGRNTEDVDLIMAVSSLKKLPEIKITAQDQFFARGIFENIQIDILLTRNPLFAHIQRAYTVSQLFQEQEIISATSDGLIILKLYALPSLYRQGDFARAGLYENDIATLMYYHKPDLEPLLDTLSRYVSEGDLVAIRDTVSELRQRITRFQAPAPPPFSG